ncbi:hypothetical protein [Actinoplanes sp. RD1]|uniref:hypothetical protein n=1 Tax=Actinoplanes sp. RD1 TaxID=3064538 RepID=UPI0027418ADE|nr:hypothetical protein [Actinoplanes sp. RD1]
MLLRRVLAAAAVLVIGVTGLVAAAPAVAATACPGCSGLRDLGDGIWAERDDPRYEIAVRGARGRVEFFWGERITDPRIVFCASESCYRRLSGGLQRRNWTVVLPPDGVTEAAVGRELTLAEFHQRVGPVVREVPPWFDAGLAALVAGDDRYVTPPARRIDRCRIPYEQALPVLTADWAQATSGGKDWPVTQAACLVSRWAHRHNGGIGVNNLVTRLESGDEFDAVVRPDPPLA